MTDKSIFDVSDLEKEIEIMEDEEDKNVQLKEWDEFFIKLSKIPKDGLSDLQKTIYITICKAKLQERQRTKAEVVRVINELTDGELSDLFYNISSKELKKRLGIK